MHRESYFPYTCTRNTFSWPQHRAACQVPRRSNYKLQSALPYAVKHAGSHTKIMTRSAPAPLSRESKTRHGRAMYLSAHTHTHTHTAVLTAQINSSNTHSRRKTHQGSRTLTNAHINYDQIPNTLSCPSRNRASSNLEWHTSLICFEFAHPSSFAFLVTRADWKVSRSHSPWVPLMVIRGFTRSIRSM